MRRIARSAKPRKARSTASSARITLTGDLDAEQRKRLLEIADKCPVHRTLTSEIDIRTTENAMTPSPLGRLRHGTGTSGPSGTASSGTVSTSLPC